MQRRYITTAIPYVNAQPHIGFAMELIQADAYARFWRQSMGSERVRLLRGSDENSLKNVRAAEAADEDIESFVERHANVFIDLQDTLNLSFDDFIRTREERHMKGAQKLWAACKDDDIYKKSYAGLYCVGCEMFYTEKECPDGICPDHKKPLEEIEEENYFFRLSAYEDQLKELIENDTIKIVPESRKNEMLSFIEQGLEDFSISRSQERAQHWGVPVPGDESQVMYVWFDALSNYINALGYADNDALFEEFWNNDEVKRVHMIGKGINRFHSIYWPAMLLSAGLPLPHEIFVHGYITLNGEKMSKSLGNVLHPNDAVNEYGADAVRYYFLREIPATGDGDFSHERMEERYAELANQLGNLVSRVAAMAGKYFDGQLDPREVGWQKHAADLEGFMDTYQFKAYIDYVFDGVRQANEIIDKKAPFKLIKTDEQAAKEVLSDVAEIIRWVGKALVPIMPEAAEKILQRYHEDGRVEKGEALFPRRD